MGFQTTPAASTFAPAIAGDFADHNPRVNLSAGPGGLVAGPSGVYVGRFCWTQYSFLDPDDAPTICNSFGVGNVAGFVGNNLQGLNTTYLSDSSVLIRQGLMNSAVYSEGGFWVVNSGANAVVPDMVAYANLSNGLVTFGAAGSPTTGTVATSAIAAGTFSGFTASLSGNILTVTAVGTGSIYPGATLTAGGAAAGTMITAQLTGTTGGVGTYSVSIPEQAVASNSGWGGTYGILTLGAVPTAQVPVGALLTGTGVVAGTYVGAYIVGSGSASGNTLAVSNNTVVASTTITFTQTVATKWLSRSGGPAGGLIKMSSWPQG